MSNNQTTSEVSLMNDGNKDTTVLPKLLNPAPVTPSVIDHEQVMAKLLNQLSPIDFKVLLGMNPTDPLSEKNYVVGIIMNLMDVAKTNNWGLCKAYDYVYVYNGAYWHQFDKDDLKRFLGEAAAKMGFKQHEAEHYEFKERLFKQFMSAAHLPTPKKLKNRILINLQNGTCEFTSTGASVRAFDPRDFITYQLPFQYDDKATCPMFEQYLLEVLPDEESRMILQEYVGYIFTGLNLEKCLMLIGSGQNGKSVFFNILSALLGPNNILEFPIGLFKSEYNRAKLVNKLVNYSSEKGDDLDPDTFKALVSGEPLQAREPYGRSFTINNKVRLIFNTNELPKQTDHTDAYFRRFIVLPFTVKIPEEKKDIHLADKIIAVELPGVFNWLLAGVNRLISNNAFSHCKASERALGMFQEASDNVALFIKENNLQPSDKNKIPLSELYRLYKEFCKDDGYKQCSKNKFSERFEKWGFEKTRMTGGATAFLVKSIPIRTV